MRTQQAETVVPLAPRHQTPADRDQLDQAGQSILQLLHRAAGVAEENSRHALDMARKLSHQLRAAEDRVAAAAQEPRSLTAADFAINCSLVQPGRPRYPVLIHRAAALLHASFRRHLATTPLRFANPSPPSGWIEDFHLQAVDHTRHTIKSPGTGPGLSCRGQLTERVGLISGSNSSKVLKKLKPKSDVEWLLQ